MTQANSSSSGFGSLSGLKIVDAGNMIAGPMATVLLADHGAEIIKIEHPTQFDPLRDWEPKKNETSLWWKVLNRNKQLVTLDLSKPLGRELFLELVARCDIVFENFRPGTFERWDLSYEELSQVNPGLILVRVSGYGQTGPFATRPGYGTIAEAMSGIPFFTGAPDGPPTLPGFPMADTVTGVFAAFAAMTALHERSKNAEGRGQVVDIALYESLFRLVDSQVIGFDQLGLVKERMGNRLGEDAPRNAYETADGGWIAISASSNRTWTRLATAIGRSELATDERFSTASNRVRNVEELDAILAAWFLLKDAAAAMDILDGYDVTAGPVLSVADIFEHPQYTARENVIEVPDPDFGIVRMQGVVPKFSRTPGAVSFPGLEPGAHNAEIFEELLGVTQDRMAILRDAAVI